MSSFELENKGDSGVLVLDGELTVQRADELRAALMNSLSCAGRLVISFEDVTGVDLSCLQLLCAARMTSAKRNKRLAISGGMPEVFKRAVRDAGYWRHIACMSD